MQLSANCVQTNAKHAKPLPLTAYLVILLHLGCLLTISALASLAILTMEARFACHAILSARHVPTIFHAIHATQTISDWVLSALARMVILMQIRLNAKNAIIAAKRVLHKLLALHAKI